MKQYEFMSVPMTTAAMAAHGLEGWMIKAVHAGIVFMEREIEPPPPVSAAEKMADPSPAPAAPAVFSPVTVAATPA